MYGTSLASAAQYPHPVRIGDVLVLPLTALHARQSRWAQALDWALGRGWAPWTVLEGEKDGGGLQGLVAHGQSRVLDKVARPLSIRITIAHVLNVCRTCRELVATNYGRWQRRQYRQVASTRTPSDVFALDLV